MQTTKVRYGFDSAFPQNWPCQWRIFVQRQVSAGPFVIVGVGAKHAAQMCLPDNDQMIQALSSDRSDQPFDIGVLPGRAWRRGTIPDSHGSNTSPEYLSVGAIAITDEVGGRCIPRKGLRDLAGDPVGRRISGDSDMNQLAPFMAYDEQPE